MITYNIPEVYIPGFENIIKLTEDEIKSFTQILADLKIGENPENIVERIVAALPSFTNVAIIDMVRSLGSLVDIFESAKRDIDIFTTGFAESYILSNTNATKEDSLILKDKLSALLSVYDSIRITAKVRNVLFENQNNFKQARIVSDVRLVFDENLEENKKYAVVVHNLKLEFVNSDISKEFFVALDLSDLKKIKEVVDRAIEKDRVIRDSKYVLNFIDI